MVRTEHHMVRALPPSEGTQIKPKTPVPFFDEIKEGEGLMVGNRIN